MLNFHSNAFFFFFWAIVVSKKKSAGIATPHLIFDAAQNLEVLFWYLPSKHLNILLDPLIFTWFGNNTCSPLESPLNEHLPWGFVQFLRYLQLNGWIELYSPSVIHVISRAWIQPKNHIFNYFWFLNMCTLSTTGSWARFFSEEPNGE